VSFLGMHDYRGVDGDEHVIVSQLTGRQVRVEARRRFIDATYVESVIPSRHTPSFAVDPAAVLLTPNQLVHYGGGSNDFVVLGGGKTAMDTCSWLLDHGVDPGAIRWVRPRDGWFVDRTYTQPLTMAASMAAHQAAIVETAAVARSGLDFALRMEERGMMMRFEAPSDPEVFRGATLSRLEFDQLQTIERVIRQGRVEAVGTDRLRLTDGDVATGPGVVHIDCTAPGLTAGGDRPIYGPATMHVQLTTMGVSPRSAALLGFVETLALPDDERNRLCPPIPRRGLIASHLEYLLIGLSADPPRRANADITAWNESSRLNPGRSIVALADVPEVKAALDSIASNYEAAVANLTARLGRYQS
jgi:hypothetical protein